MLNITNFDICEEMFRFIKEENTSMSNFLKEYGGTNVYIPSFKKIYRDDEIIEEYKKNPTKATVRKLARDHELCEQQVYKITRAIRKEKN